uniref:Ctl n=2 Tax=Mamestra configurata nucleopolyhedrovirus TaxID=207830 RepID=A0A5B9G9C8_NPVMC|nr:ctl [Mamestra configurata nucleopolyhedrovirus A]
MCVIRKKTVVNVTKVLINNLFKKNFVYFITKLTCVFVMHIKSILLFVILAAANYGAMACTDTGRNCKYSYECCSGACSAAFGFCLHR